jgi:hypothetical protein
MRLRCDAARGLGDEQQDEEEAESVEKANHVCQRRGREDAPDLAELARIHEPGLLQQHQRALACAYLYRERRQREQHERADEEQESRHRSLQVWSPALYRLPGAMVFLPRLARALNKPGIATVLGLVLVAVAIIGMTSGEIRTLWAIIILVVGAINLLRAIPTRDAS